MKKLLLALSLLFITSHADAATITANVGAAGNWNSDSSWIGGVKPTAADDAVIPLATTSITIDAGSVARSADFNTFTGTVTHNSGAILTLGDGTAGTGNIALRLVSGMTYAPSVNTCEIAFVSTSATQQTITTGGKSLGKMTINGTGSSYLLSDGLNLRSDGQLTLTTGTFNTGNNSMSIGFFNSSNSTARTLTLGSSAISVVGISSSSAWTTSTITNLTLTANTSTITLSGSASGFVSGAGQAYNTVEATGSGAFTLNTASSLATFTRTGTAAKTDSFVLSQNLTVTGTLTVNGNSSTNRMLVTGATLGTARTITAAAVSINNADLRDITGAGAASWDLSAGSVGNCGGNSLKSLGTAAFTTAQTNYWIGGTGNWSDVNEWANSSGGSAASGRVPLAQDSVRFDASSFSAGSQTVTADMPRLGKSIDWTGASGTPTYVITSISNTMYGSLTLISGMNVTTSGSTTTFEGRSACTITSAGKILSNVVANMVGGTLTLNDAFGTVSGTNLSLTRGSFFANGFNVSVLDGSQIIYTGSATNLLNMGSGIWTFSGNGNVCNIITPSTFLTASTSTIFMSNTSASSKTFIGGGGTYYDFKIAGGGAGAIIITGANTFNRIYTDGGGTKSITLPGSTTTTILSGLGLNNGTNAVTFTASSGTATVSKTTGGSLEWPYVHLTNIAATQTNKFYAPNSTNNGGNTNWIFGRMPRGNAITPGLGLMMEDPDSIYDRTF